MLAAAVTLNALLLLAVAVLLRRGWRPSSPAVAAGEFATVLEAEQGGGGDPDPIAIPPTVTLTIWPLGRNDDAGEAPLRPGLALSKRLAIVRHMLQGKSAEETASATGVEAAAARAVYRLHHRDEGKAC
jgi:hypothetical protein